MQSAIRAGDQVGCSGSRSRRCRRRCSCATAIRLRCKWSRSEPDEESGRRSVSIYSRADVDGAWVATPRACRDGSVEPALDMSAWPPSSAAIQVADGHERLAAHGYAHARASRAHRGGARGDELFAEVQFPEQAGGVAGFGGHLALLDAALHAVVVAERDPDRCAALPPGRCVTACRRASAVLARFALAAEMRSPSSSPIDWGCRCCQCARWWRDRSTRSNCGPPRRLGPAWIGCRGDRSRRPATLRPPARRATTIVSIAAESDPVVTARAHCSASSLSGHG